MTHFNQDTQTKMIRFTRHVVMVCALFASASSSAHINIMHVCDEAESDLSAAKSLHAPSIRALFNSAPVSDLFEVEDKEQATRPATTPLNFDFTVEVADEGQSAFQKVSQAVGSFFAKF